MAGTSGAHSRRYPYKYQKAHDEEPDRLEQDSPLLSPSQSSSSIMSTSSLSEKHAYEAEKDQHHATAEYREVDEAAQLSTQGSVDPEEALRIRYEKITRIDILGSTLVSSRKIDKHILPLMCGMFDCTSSVL